MQHQAKSDLADPIHDSFTPPLTSLSRDGSIMPHETSGGGHGESDAVEPAVW
jgi:hypothetical protein